MSALFKQSVSFSPRIDIDDLISSMGTDPSWDKFFLDSHFVVEHDELGVDIGNAEVFHASISDDGDMIVGAVRDEEFWASPDWPEWFLLFVTGSLPNLQVIEGEVIESYVRYGAPTLIHPEVSASPQ